MKNDPLITTPSDLHTAASEPDDPAEAVLRALNAREVLSPDHANALWWALRSLQTVEVQSLLLVANRMNLGRATRLRDVDGRSIRPCVESVPAHDRKRPDAHESHPAKA